MIKNIMKTKVGVGYYPNVSKKIQMVLGVKWILVELVR